MLNADRKRRIAGYALATEAAATLAASSFRLRVVDRRRLVRLLGEARPIDAIVEPTPVEHLTANQRADLVAARRIGRIVTRVAGLLPWHPTCLRQSLTTHRMLRRRGIDSEIRLGVADVRSMDSHAWVTVGGRTVNGRVERRFTPIASF